MPGGTFDDRADFQPTATWERLRLRAALLRRLRAFFDARGFLEVETPAMSADTVVDRHIDPFPVEGVLGGCPRPFYLQTSPEFHMKRMLSAGATAIYQVCRVFRREEIGPLHNPEFTMVEWYRAGDDQQSGMQLLSDLVEELLGRGACEQVSYGEAFARFVGLDPHTAAAAELEAAARRLGVAAPESYYGSGDRDAWLDLLLGELVQPRLGCGAPAILYDYPASQAALAQVRREDPPVAERFELYIDGVEIANGYHELLDAAELRRRNAAVSAQRVADGKPALPEESRLLAAMESRMPPAVGVALGFDRLCMAAAGAKEISEVIAFPVDRA